MTYKPKTYYIKTYGCQMNVADSERIAGWYEEKGWQLAKAIEAADEVVINTCSVRQTAEDRVFGQVNNLSKLKIKNLKLKIILTGCMLRYPLKWLKEKLPQVDEFKKISEYRVRDKDRVRESQGHAYVPIMEGCNNFCSYCVVPYARGREKSRSFEEIICEVEELTRRGYKEITLLGQNVNSYGNDFNRDERKRPFSYLNDIYHLSESLFAFLLRSLHEIDGIKKISFLTSNPWDLSDDIIGVMNLPKIDRYLHLPVQSGDDKILKKMNRKYTAKDFIKLTEKIRKKIPDIKIGTDIIVGFPGETEEQFNNTVLLCRKVGFVKAYVSKYSPRQQTAAYKIKDDISHKEKKRRWLVLNKMING